MEQKKKIASEITRIHSEVTSASTFLVLPESPLTPGEGQE
jgi:hypothetical protein